VAAGERSETSGTIRYRRPDGSGEIERFVVSGGDRMLRSNTGDMTVCMRTHGTVTFADDGTRIGSLGPESWVVIGSRDAQRTVEMVVTQGASGLSYLWYVNGSLRPMSSEGTEWRDAVLPVVASLWNLVEMNPQRETLEERQALLRASREVRELDAAQRASLEAAAAQMRELQRQSVAVDRQLEQARVAQPTTELEQLRRQLEVVAQELQRASPGSTPQVDSLRVLLEQTRAAVEARVASDQVERLARAQRQQVEELNRVREARAAEVEASGQRVREMAETQRVMEERRAQMMSEMDANRQQMQDLLRRLQEAMRRIP
jgi:hypothetical protein